MEVTARNPLPQAIANTAPVQLDNGTNGEITLLTLPREIRDRIYAHLPRRDPICIEWARGTIIAPFVQILVPEPPINANLMLTCTRLHDEYRDFVFNNQVVRAMLDLDHDGHQPSSTSENHERQSRLAKGVLKAAPYIDVCFLFQRRDEADLWEPISRVLYIIGILAPRITVLRVLMQLLLKKNVSSRLAQSVTPLDSLFSPEDFLPAPPVRALGLGLVQCMARYHTLLLATATPELLEVVKVAAYVYTNRLRYKDFFWERDDLNMRLTMDSD
jgi:hypothetical protein